MGVEGPLRGRVKGRLARFSSSSSSVTNLNSLDPPHPPRPRRSLGLLLVSISVDRCTGTVSRTSSRGWTLSFSRSLTVSLKVKPTTEQSLLGLFSRSRRTENRVRGKRPGFLAGNSRLFIVTWRPFLRNPRGGQPLQGRPTVSEPPFRLCGNRFFARGCNFPGQFLSRTRSTGQPNSLACAQRPGGHFLATPVWVILKSPPFQVSPPSPVACVVRRSLIPRHDSRMRAR